MTKRPNAVQFNKTLRQLQSSDPGLRVDAAMALSSSRSPKGSRALLLALRDPVAEVRLRAAESLGVLLVGREAPRPLIRALSDENPLVRAEAADSLGATGDTRAVPALWRATGDENPIVRTYVTQALGYLGREVDLKRLGQFRASERHPLVRLAIDESVGRIALKVAVRSLGRRLKSSHYRIRCAAANALGDLLECAQAATEALGLLQQASLKESTRAGRASIEASIRCVGRRAARHP